MVGDWDGKQWDSSHPCFILEAICTCSFSRLTGPLAAPSQRQNSLHSQKRAGLGEAQGSQPSLIFGKGLQDYFWKQNLSLIQLHVTDQGVASHSSLPNTFQSFLMRERGIPLPTKLRMEIKIENNIELYCKLCLIT